MDSHMRAYSIRLKVIRAVLCNSSAKRDEQTTFNWLVEKETLETVVGLTQAEKGDERTAESVVESVVMRPDETCESKVYYPAPDPTREAVFQGRSAVWCG